MMSDTFARILAAGRAHFNQRVVEARRRHPSLDTAAFSEFLLACADPLVAEAARIDATRSGAVAMAAYDLALELTGLGLVGPASRSKWVSAAWCELAPQLMQLVVQQPAEVLGLLSNAVLHIESVAGARPAQWMEEMGAAGPRLDSLADLQAAGQVIAWRSGIAHFRMGAIEAAGRLAPTLAASLFGGGQPWAATREALAANPWWKPGEGRASGTEAGGFAGFGGLFTEPPAVRPHPDGFAVRSGGRFHVLIADAWGAVMHAAAAEEFDERASGHTDAFSLHVSTLRIGGREIALDLPPDGLEAWCNGPTVAVTSPYTHAILLYPAR